MLGKIISLGMTIQEKRLNYSDLSRLRTLGYRTCYKCNIDFKFDDVIIKKWTHSNPTYSGNTKYYHKQCWEKLLY